MRYKMAYCTLSSVIQQLLADANAIDVSTVAAQNTRIATESANFRAYTARLIYEVSSIMSFVMGAVFVPYRQTQSFRRMQIRGNLTTIGDEYHLRMPEDILEIKGITWVGVVVDSSKFRLAHDGLFYPDYAIAVEVGSVSTFPYEFSENVAVDGIWGYHKNPLDMWQTSGKTVQGSTLTSSGTALTVESGGGSSFEILQYIRIENEYLLVTDINADILTVERGKNGTTAASHIVGTGIDKFRGMPEIENEARRLAIRHYELKGGFKDAIVFSGEEAIEINPNDVKKIIPTKFSVRSVR